MGDQSITLALIGLVATLLAIVGWTVKFIFRFLSNELKENTQAHLKNAASTGALVESVKSVASQQERLCRLLEKQAKEGN